MIACIQKEAFYYWSNLFCKDTLKIFLARDVLHDESEKMAACHNSFEAYASESVQISSKSFLPQNPGRKISRNITVSNIKADTS